MEFIIQHNTNDGEKWIWATETETQEIDAGRYMRGGVVHCILTLKDYLTLQNNIAILNHRISGMREAVRRWRQKVKPQETCESNCNDGDLDHFKTEYVRRQYEDEGRWICLKHMLLKNVEPSEELGQLAFEEVMRLSPELKKEKVLPTKIYFCNQGWVCVFDWTSQEPYL